MAPMSTYQEAASLSVVRWLQGTVGKGKVDY